MHSSINHFSFFSLFVLFFNPKGMRALLLSSPEIKLFDLYSLPQDYLTFLGDSHLEDGVIALTKANMSTDAPRSAGIVLYNRPILFLDPHLKKVPSFSTTFTFTIRNIGEDGSSGDGLAFLISPENYFLGSPGYLGLVNSTDLSGNKFVAIEFDTKRDPIFQDPNDNHLGLDINSLSSVQIAIPFGVNLKSGNIIGTWIDYKSDEKRLEVFLSDSISKPERPLLKVDIDLFDYLKENMFVGFSAATDGSVQLTYIEQWEFTIADFSPSPPPSPSPLELGRTFPNPSESGYTRSYLSRLAVGLIIVVCSVSLIVGFGCFCCKQLMGMIQKSEGKNNLKLQTITSSEGTSSQVIRLSIPDTNPDEVARGLIIEKVLDNKGEHIRVQTVKPSIPLSATVRL